MMRLQNVVSLLLIALFFNGGVGFLTDVQRIRDMTLRLNGRSLQLQDSDSYNFQEDEGYCVPKNIIATRMQIYNYEAIITQPRYRRGVPATLVSTTLNDGNCYLKTYAFPNWEMQEEGNCEAIQSAVDLFLDKNDKLWVLDGGTVNLLDMPSTKCPPKIVCIDMATKSVVKKIELSAYCFQKSGVQFIVVENGPNGNDHLYISDGSGKAVIVINAKTEQGTRLSLHGMLSDCPEDSTLHMALLMKDFKNYLYLTYANCSEIYSIETSKIHISPETPQACSCSGSEEIDSQIHCVMLAGKKPESYDITFCGTDNLSRLYFRKVNKNQIYTWDANTLLKLDECSSIQTGSPDRLITHVTPGPGKMLWYMESNANDFISGKTGRMGASTIIKPIATEVNRRLMRLDSILNYRGY